MTAHSAHPSCAKELSTSDQWALDISLEALKADLAELLREHSAQEVAEIIAERRRHRALSPAE